MMRRNPSVHLLSRSQMRIRWLARNLGTSRSRPSIRPVRPCGGFLLPLIRDDRSSDPSMVSVVNQPDHHGHDDSGVPAERERGTDGFQWPQQAPAPAATAIRFVRPTAARRRLGGAPLRNATALGPALGAAWLPPAGVAVMNRIQSGYWYLDTSGARYRLIWKGRFSRPGSSRGRWSRCAAHSTRAGPPALLRRPGACQ